MIPKRDRASVYTIRVTDVLFGVETIDDIGLPSEGIWRAEKIYYGIRIKGRRVDQTNMPTISAIYPVKHGGDGSRPNIGDLLLILEDPSLRFPVVIGTLFSQSTTWTEATKNFERPILPQLESPGSFGEIYNYNAIYGTYVPNYRSVSGETWYDRFVKFPVGHIVKDKRSLVAYNPWFKEVLESKDKNLSSIILGLVEDWSCFFRKEKFFYLERNKWAYRPDPVFDTTSSSHQNLVSGKVVKAKGGVGFFDSREKSDTDKYPLPITQQTLDADSVFTAFDEIINAELAEKRKNNNNQDNAELPLEPRVLQEIRIGRNKLIISDMYGDGTAILISLKSEKDSGISIIYQEFTECDETVKDCQKYKTSEPDYPVEIPTSEGKFTEASDAGEANTSCDNKKISQIRIRGKNGESILLESKENDDFVEFSRFVVKGTNGQFFELFDDHERSANYAYLISPNNKDYTTDSWYLDSYSFFFQSSGDFDTGFLRISNNEFLSEVSGANNAIAYGFKNGDRKSLDLVLNTGSETYEHFIRQNGCAKKELSLHIYNGYTVEETLTYTDCSSTLRDSITISGEVNRTITYVNGSKYSTWQVLNTNTTKFFVTDGSDQSYLELTPLQAKLFSTQDVVVEGQKSVTLKYDDNNKITIDASGIEVGTSGVSSVRLAGGGNGVARRGDQTSDGASITTSSSKVTSG